MNLVLDSDGGLEIRRYDQFEAMAQLFDSNFDNSMITNYGCNCPELGDRPLSDQGKGMPVDPLDKVCQKFKQCTKCAKEEFGEDCISEIIKYKFNKSDANCKDTSGSCERALCECDRMFAFDLAGVDPSSVNESKYGMSSSFDRSEDCVHKENSTPTNRQCCWSGEGPFSFYNSDSKQCCDNGNTVGFGKSCDDKDEPKPTEKPTKKPEEPTENYTTETTTLETTTETTTLETTTETTTSDPMNQTTTTPYTSGTTTTKKNNGGNNNNGY